MILHQVMRNFEAMLVLVKIYTVNTMGSLYKDLHAFSIHACSVMRSTHHPTQETK
jgi:hypothetical protein